MVVVRHRVDVGSNFVAPESGIVQDTPGNENGPEYCPERIQHSAGFPMTNLARLRTSTSPA